MIEYETADSPFFTVNKKYCETIEGKLKTLNLDCSGFCNSFGYEIEATLKRDKLTYRLVFSKYQTTRSGVIVPQNAVDSFGTEVTVTGLDKKYSLTIGEDSRKRFFGSKKFKDKVPAPYYFKANYSPDDSFINNLVNQMLYYKFSKFNLSNGTLVCSSHEVTSNPQSLIADIDAMIKNWQ